MPEKLDALDQVTTQMGPGYRVTPQAWHGPAAIELYRAHDDNGPPDNVVGLAVAPGSTAARPLRGADAMRAVLAATRDPMALAEAAALLLFDGIVVDPAQARPPAVAGSTLTFWTRGRGRPHLMRATVDLSSLTSDLVSPEEIRGAGKDPVDLAVARLSSPNRFEQQQGVDELVRLARKDARATAALEQSLAVVRNPDARTTAIKALAKAPGGGTARALADVLTRDPDAPVRQLAATTLGKLRDAVARPALEAAMTSDASNLVRAAARAALAQLDGP